jgi:hypothetical protein
MARQSKMTTTTAKQRNSKGGRPTKLTQELVDQALTYVIENDNLLPNSLLPTVERLSIILNVSRETLYAWDADAAQLSADKKQVPSLLQQFSDIFTRLKAIQADKLLQWGLAKRYDSTITKLMLSKHGYVEKSEVDNNLKGDVQFVNAVPRGKK